MLPIHYASGNSSLDGIKFLLKVHPELVTMVISGEENSFQGCNLLHLACQNDSNIADAKAIVEYLCKLCSALVHMRDNQGDMPLHLALAIQGELNIEFVRILCNTDESVLKDKCTPTATTSTWSQQLPLHLLIQWNPLRSEVSNGFSVSFYS
jgi:hypothetical protein